MSPWQLLLIVAVVLVAYYVKGIVGLGGPLLIIPLVAGITGLEYAVAVIAIPNLIANTILVWRTRGAFREVSWFLMPLLIAGAIGTVVGTWLLVSYDDRWAALTLGLLILAYIAWTLARPDFRLGRRSARLLSPAVGLAGGVLQGGTGVSGPVIGTYVHALDVTRTSFVLAVTLPFQVLSTVQVASLTVLGAYDRERLVAAGVATVPMLIGLAAGMRFGDRLSEERFGTLVLVILAVAAVRLIWSVL